MVKRMCQNISCKYGMAEMGLRSKTHVIAPDKMLFGQVFRRKIFSFKIVMYGWAGIRLPRFTFWFLPFFKVIYMYYLYSSVEKTVHNAFRHFSCFIRIVLITNCIFLHKNMLRVLIRSTLPRCF